MHTRGGLLQHTTLCRCSPPTLPLLQQLQLSASAHRRRAIGVRGAPCFSRPPRQQQRGQQATHFPGASKKTYDEGGAYDGGRDEGKVLMVARGEARGKSQSPAVDGDGAASETT